MVELVLADGLNLVLRWLHVIAGIAWIGTSFYFIALDLALRDPGGLPAGVKGESWQVHGGGFYRMRKYTVAPAELPNDLTWFKWEAYTTWLAGFALLVIQYYGQAQLYLIDPAVWDLTPWAAALIGAGSLVLGFVVYEALCRSSLGRHDGRLALVGYGLLVAASWGYTQVFSGRGALIHIGALIGTLMVASVAHVIIPNQRKVVAALLRGERPDPALGAQARQRSLHNNYLTLPVVFLMISGHYPLVFASQWNWVIVALLLLVGAAVRHFFNERHRGRPSPWWTWAVATAGMVLVVWLGLPPAADAGQAGDLLPRAVAAEGQAASDVVAFAAAVEVVGNHCTACHAAEPAWAGLVTAPKGLQLEGAAAVARHARAIVTQAVVTHAMPPGNASMITLEERAQLAAGLWPVVLGRVPQAE